MKAIWNGAVIAESNDTIVLEGNQYFPMNSLNKDYVRESGSTAYCPRKGVATYFDIFMGDQVLAHAIWIYREPKASAQAIAGRIAFGPDVRVEP